MRQPWYEPNKDSDIEIYIVTKDDFVPRNFKEKIESKLKYGYAIDHIRDSYAVDLIVHTRPLHRRFKDINTDFHRY